MMNIKRIVSLSIVVSLGFVTNSSAVNAAQMPYANLLNGYKVCLDNSMDFTNNKEKYLDQYPEVDVSIIETKQETGLPVYYALYDIDGNGHDELVIGIGEENYVNPVVIYTYNEEDIYELVGNDVLSWRGSFQVYNDGTIYTHDGGQGQFEHCFYHISENGHDLQMDAKYEENMFEYDAATPFFDGNRYYTSDEFYSRFYDMEEIELSWSSFSEALAVNSDEKRDMEVDAYDDDLGRFLGKYAVVQNVSESPGNPTAISIFLDDEGNLGIAYGLYYSTTGTTTIGYYDEYEIKGDTLECHLKNLGSLASDHFGKSRGIDRVTLSPAGSITVELSGVWSNFIDVDEANTTYYLD